MSREILEGRIDRLRRASSRPGDRRAAQVREMHDIWADIHLEHSVDDRDRLKAKFLRINRRRVPLRGLQ